MSKGKKETNTVEITTFKEYVEQHCPGITVDNALHYADDGQKLLSDVLNNNITKKGASSDDMAKLHWHLIRQSFENGKPFSKGTFNLECESKADTQKLYNFLKGESIKESLGNLAKNAIQSLFRSAHTNDRKAYPRASSHYHGSMVKEGAHFGIDMEKKDDTPLAWKFTTHVFGLTKNKNDDNCSIYIKPETESADLNKTKESIRHGLNLVKSIIGSKEKIVGMSKAFREDDVPAAIKQFVKDECRDVNVKKIDGCKSIDDLRTIFSKAVNRDNKKMQSFEVKVKSTCGTSNQMGSEIRYTVKKNGALEDQQKNATVALAVKSNPTHEFKGKMNVIKPPPQSPSPDQSPTEDSTVKYN
jgi:hypothetical protein